MKKHFWVFDWLRGLAAFGIVGCHLNLGSVSPGAKVLLSYCDLNVGLFAALAGFFMARSVAVGAGDGTAISFILKRAGRLLPPYFFWTAVYLVAGVVFDRLMGKPIGFDWRSIYAWCCVLFQGGAACHLWFLVCLMYAQSLLAYPLFRMEERFHRVVFIVAGFIGIGLASWVGGWLSAYPFRLISFLVFGAGVYGWIDRFKNLSMAVAGTLLVSALVLHRYCACLAFVNDLAVVFAVMLAGIIGSERFTREGGRCGEIAAVFSATSMGVFLMHPLFAAFLGQKVLPRVFTVPYGVDVVLLHWSTIWALSFGMAWAGLHIPAVKRLRVL
jgi:peptidoglycan/LPS O-acetylase OafA/YrhL